MQIRCWSVCKLHLHIRTGQEEGPSACLSCAACAKKRGCFSFNLFPAVVDIFVSPSLPPLLSPHHITTPPIWSHLHVSLTTSGRQAVHPQSGSCGKLQQSLAATPGKFVAVRVARPKGRNKGHKISAPRGRNHVHQISSGRRYASALSECELRFAEKAQQQVIPGNDPCCVPR